MTRSRNSLRRLAPVAATRSSDGYTDRRTDRWRTGVLDGAARLPLVLERATQFLEGRPHPESGECLAQAYRGVIAPLSELEE